MAITPEVVVRLAKEVFLGLTDAGITFVGDPQGQWAMGISLVRGWPSTTIFCDSAEADDVAACGGLLTDQPLGHYRTAEELRSFFVACRDSFVKNLIALLDLAHGPLRTMDDFERCAIESALAATGGNKVHAARRLGISRHRLYDKLRKFGIRPAP